LRVGELFCWDSVNLLNLIPDFYAGVGQACCSVSFNVEYRRPTWWKRL